MKIVYIVCSVFGLTSGFCPNGWIRFYDSCYYFEDTQKEPWHVAFNYCVALDADLVKVETSRENNFIKAELKKLHPDSEDQFWTAGNDIQIEKEWVWAGTNGPVAEFTDWTPGEPNQSGGEEDCLSFYPRQGYHWNDEHCDKPMYYICEHEDPEFGGGEVVG